MTRMEYELNRTIHLYLRTRGKKNRKNQVEKIKSFCRDIQKHNLQTRSLAQIGRSQVCDFWRRENDLAPSTKTAYCYGIQYIWEEVLNRK